MDVPQRDTVHQVISRHSKNDIYFEALRKLWSGYHLSIVFDGKQSNSSAIGNSAVIEVMR